MYAGVVSGSVVATVKDSGLEGVPLLIVRKIENGKEAGLIIAADHTRQAGIVRRCLKKALRYRTAVARYRPSPGRGP